MPETWYLLEDGSHADPAEVAPDAAGVLRHKGGAAVAVGPHGPRSRGMDAKDVEAARAKDKAAARTAARQASKERETHSPDDRQVTPLAGAPYETR